MKQMAFYEDKPQWHEKKTNFAFTLLLFQTYQETVFYDVGDFIQNQCPAFDLRAT